MGGQKRNFSFNVCFGEVVHIYVSISFWGYREEKIETQKKKKKTKEEL
jgi:hypothetical protein